MFKIVITISMIVVVITFTILPYMRNAIKNNLKRKRYLDSGISDIDKMQGIEFEEFLKVHFERLGYHVKTTKTTNDYGADLILKKERNIIVVQAKRYKSRIGINAIQEVIGAIRYYKGMKGMVITNSYFTKNAINLAKANQIELWDRNKLIEVMLKNNGREISSQIINNVDGICPLCKGQLVEKVGPYGEFYGCKNYPKCDFRRKKRG
ncbi:restriction endonuclease [Anaeromicropila herbilytica]|nr:restriction endonuclease [Anaeromicropila herbilytica]